MDFLEGLEEDVLEVEGLVDGCEDVLGRDVLGWEVLLDEDGLEEDVLGGGLFELEEELFVGFFWVLLFFVGVFLGEPLLEPVVFFEFPFFDLLEEVPVPFFLLLLETIDWDEGCSIVVLEGTSILWTSVIVVISSTKYIMIKSPIVWVGTQ